MRRAHKIIISILVQCMWLGGSADEWSPHQTHNREVPSSTSQSFLKISQLVCLLPSNCWGFNDVLLHLNNLFVHVIILVAFLQTSWSSQVHFHYLHVYHLPFCMFRGYFQKFLANMWSLLYDGLHPLPRPGYSKQPMLSHFIRIFRKFYIIDLF